MTIKRINQLRIGDVCVKYSNQWFVFSDDGITKVLKRNLPNPRDRTQLLEIGSKSMEKVEYIGVLKNKKNIKFKIVAFEWGTKNVVNYYSSALNASKDLGVTTKHIFDYINKIYKNPNFNLGYHFEKKFVT